ncbi:FAD-dependent oxidoreductase [Candidatus Parcubacteria bacterium]|nr:FAD-dependent oxidoreductase [Candidatus Parcubacteria bacterium]
MIYDSIIIGAGPAGITAAVYAARKGMKIAVLSKNIGGQVTRTSIVENYTGYQEISGIELAEKFNDHLKEFNFKFKKTEVQNIEKRDDIFIIKTSLEKFQSRSLIMATGAMPRELNIPGEKEYKNKGVTYCATCDAPLFHDKEVAVIGGGNSALEASLQLTKIAKKIYIINNTSTFTGDKILSDKLEKNKKVKIFHNSETSKISGDRFVQELEFSLNKKIKKIAVQGVFIEIGFIPNTKLVENFIKLNSKNEIEVNLNQNSSDSGIFAAGDCTNIPYKQIVIAAGSGATAALSAFEYLTKSKN